MSKIISFEEKLTRKVSKMFPKKRIVSLLYFGTRAFDLNINEDSDYDFMLVLDKYAPKDTQELRRIVQNREFVGLDINLNLLYLSDIKARGKTNFQIRSLSLPFYEYLEKSKVLLGKNIFKKNPVKLTRHARRKMEDFKIQEYYGHCDKLYFSKISDHDLYRHLRKYTKDILWLLLVREEKIKLSDLTEFPFEKIVKLAKSSSLISDPIGKELLILLNKDFSKVNLQGIEKIRRLLYQKFLNFL